jgi:hypothetical protein
MSKESNNMSGQEAAGAAEESVVIPVSPEEQFVTARVGPGLLARAMSGAAVAVTLPLLKVENAQAAYGELHCFNSFEEISVGDPGDCADCSAFANPQDCTTDLEYTDSQGDNPAPDPQGDPIYDYGQGDNGTNG